MLVSVIGVRDYHHELSVFDIVRRYQIFIRLEQGFQYKYIGYHRHNDNMQSSHA